VALNFFSFLLPSFVYSSLAPLFGFFQGDCPDQKIPWIHQDPFFPPARKVSPPSIGKGRLRHRTQFTSELPEDLNSFFFSQSLKKSLSFPFSAEGAGLLFSPFLLCMGSQDTDFFRGTPFTGLPLLPVAHLPPYSNNPTRRLNFNLCFARVQACFPVSVRTSQPFAEDRRLARRRLRAVLPYLEILTPGGLPAYFEFSPRSRKFHFFPVTERRKYSFTKAFVRFLSPKAKVLVRRQVRPFSVWFECDQFLASLCGYFSAPRLFIEALPFQKGGAYPS